jgi:hypothetical protein
MVVYKSKMMSSKSRGGKKNFKVFTADAFIAAITQHIPKESFQLVRCYSWNSNRRRGDRLKEEKAQEIFKSDIEISDVSDYKPLKIASPTWRECLKKI